MPELGPRFPLIELTEVEQRAYLQVLYEACDSGREFELFLKLLLSAMGLEDVSVTRYTRDGGIDLTARRPGIRGDRFDEVRYVVQAKRLRPDRAPSIESVRALRGVLRDGARGMFITTGRFARTAESFAAEGGIHPIVLIDGLALVSRCVTLQVGFRFQPVLEREWLRRQIAELPGARDQGTTPRGTRKFLKTITSNDIRSRIISLPSEVDILVPTSSKRLSVEFLPDIPVHEYAYSRDRRYIAGVTGVLRRLGLLGPNGEKHPKRAEWRIAPGQNLIQVRLADTSLG